MAAFAHVAKRRQKSIMTVEHTEASSMSEVGCGRPRANTCDVREEDGTGIVSFH
jgi:hypothetical protein